MKKGFIKGFIIGALVFGTVTSFATVTYSALTATFPILVNGQLWETDKPVVVIDGSTYLPLKAIGDVLNVKVNWNSELRQVEIGEAIPLENVVSYSRKNPAPLGTTQTINVSNYSNEYTANITVKEVIRGKKAWTKIKNENMFNTEPKDEYEYILAKVEVSMDTVKGDKAISINGYDFDCYSSNNVKYDKPFVVTPEPELNTSLYEGGSTVGYVVFEVMQTDENPKMVFGQGYDGTGGIWFNLCK